jgi:hypothetical protein
MVFGNGSIDKEFEKEIKSELKIKFSEEKNAFLFKMEDQKYLDSKHNLSNRLSECEEYFDSLGGFLECECGYYPRSKLKSCGKIFYLHNHIASIMTAIEDDFHDEVYNSEDWGKEVDTITRMIVNVEKGNGLKEKMIMLYLNRKKD